MAKYTFIVPVYNVELYLDRCVESIVNQMFSDFDVVLVDDGSTDSSGLLCDGWAKRNQCIRVIHKSNGGLSDARNVGLDEADGKYVIFVDSDDFVSENLCSIVDKFIELEPDVVVYDAIKSTGGFICHDISLVGKCLDGASFLKESLMKGEMPMAAVLYVYKRSFLIDHNLHFKKGILHEDEHFTPRALLLARKVVYSGEKCYKYEIRPGSITTKTDKRKNVSDLFETCKELKVLYEDIKDDKLKKLLLDSLVEKYLSWFYSADLYQYQNIIPQKSFVISNSKKIKTFIKSVLFVISPKLYCKINQLTKTMLKKIT